MASLTNGSAAAAADERAILREFYDATGGHAWNENYGWAENLPDLCDWHGVICDAQDLQHPSRRLVEGKVLGLKLNSNFVTGRTPISLWELPALQYVDLSYNPHVDVNFVGLQQDANAPVHTIKLRDTGTTSVTGLSFASETLQNLEMSTNKLNSQIPPDLYSLTQLTKLHIAECGLQGNLPNDIHRLSLLHELNLYGNSLTGALPDGMSRLVQLRHLTLSYNQFHGTLPNYLDDFLVLQELWAVNNDFSGPIPSLNRSPDIRNIHLNGNSLTGDIPEDFIVGALDGPGRRIQVNLAHNALEGYVPNTLNNLEDLDIIWTLGDNAWLDFPDSFCDNKNWNAGSVAAFGCNGFMCEPGAFSKEGYRTDDADCQPCGSNRYWGATTCFDQDDHSVLVELYVALSGESWDRNDNWLKQDDFCTWYGITCWDIGDSKDGRVRKIKLPNNNLHGMVPETMYSMKHLTTMDFSRNDIVLTFEDIGESPHMFEINVGRTNTKDFDGISDANSFFRELYVDGTPIAGTIPREIFDVQNLQVLSMQECDLSGELDEALFNLVSLEELHLSNNNLKGALPNRWNELENLQILSLANNQLKGPLPPSFDTASSLKAVSLQDQMTKGGGITGTVHPFSTSRTLRSLRLANNKLEGDLPEDFLGSLEGDYPITVDLSNNLVTGKVHGSWTRFQQLNLLLEGNFITDVEDHLCHQSDWMSGAVKSFGCDAILCPAGTMGGRREYLDSKCQVCKYTGGNERLASYLGQASCGDDAEDMSERDILELLYKKLGGDGWHAKQNWMSEQSVCDWYGIDCDESGSVTSIQLGGNQLVGSFPTEIYQLPNLVRLKLYSNTIYFNFAGIENAKSLETLSLDNTGLNSVKGIGKARSLVEVNVANNKLKGPLPEELSRLINLKSFDLSHNGLTGFLPYWLRSLVSLTTFSASHNKLSGPVHDFATLSNLIYLDVSHNQLTGPVPSTLFGSAPTDEKVVADLSSNKLSGAVPGDLSQLSRLSLQVEGNQITDIDSELCKVGGWNDFEVEAFGCNGILCPAGTWNRLGRQSNEDGPCVSCRKSKYMGTTNCHSGASMRTLGLWAVGLISWMLLA